MLTQLKVKLAIYQRRLAMLKRCHERNPNDLAIWKQMLGAWYAVNILGHLLAEGSVEPPQLFSQLAQQQTREGYGKKPYPKTFMAWIYILSQYISYRMPIRLGHPSTIIGQQT